MSFLETKKKPQHPLIEEIRYLANKLPETKDEGERKQIVAEAEDLVDQAKKVSPPLSESEIRQAADWVHIQLMADPKEHESIQVYERLNEDIEPIESVRGERARTVMTHLDPVKPYMRDFDGEIIPVDTTTEKPL